MTTPKDDFYLKVAHALSGCQLVEQELKLYITEALELAKKCIGRKIPFKMRGEDYADSSLERLIDIFMKLSDDKTLVAELHKFKKERNFLSHRAITHCMDGSGSLSHSTALELQDRLEAIQREAERLRSAIFDKAAIIGFDDLTVLDNPSIERAATGQGGGPMTTAMRPPASLSPHQAAGCSVRHGRHRHDRG